MKTVYIYTLNCPDTGKVMYVGRTVKPNVRYATHLRNGYYGHQNVNSHWIACVLKQGKVPQMSVIDTCIECDARSKEMDWIAYYLSINPDLNNVFDSPDGIQKKKQHKSKTREIRRNGLNCRVLSDEDLKKIIINRSCSFQII